MIIERSRAFKTLSRIPLLLFLSFILFNCQAFCYESDFNDVISPAKIFVKAAGIKGESIDSKYSDWIVANYMSAGVLAGITHSAASGRTASKSVFEPVEINKMYDRSSPYFFQYCADGRHIPYVHIVLTNPNTEREVEIRLDDVSVKSVNSATNQSFGNRIIESIKFIFGKIIWKYTLPDETTIVKGWDLKANKAVNDWPSNESLSMQNQKGN